MYVHSPYFKTLILLLDFSSARLQCKCELYGAGDLSNFPSEMKSISTLNFELLGAPIGDFVFCAKYASRKRAKAKRLLHTLKNVGSMDPQVALLLLC